MNRFLFSVLLFLMVGCQLFESDTKEYSLDELEELYAEIKSLAGSQTCSNSSDWDFVALGSKPCGGPWEYVAYSKKIDVPDFLEKVRQYNLLQEEYNIKNKIYSDCMYVGPPKSVVCENGNPVFVY
ncbi:hypothetical protein [Algoriphagus sp. CAU 1675]|uniref:hypothetical protein n=1 Tax=Algoriphagus sp. CAU 1675 TaxID=3032597 RepID=UPI0023DBF65D|nr:hypothetical protein [Algoriphagus sp. CAU 1675]MDF2159232.1 hypothetical protein [Algoriphagus sp. CAU 1675]